MYKSIAGFFADNADIVNGVPALQSAVVSLANTIILISQTIQQKEEPITGISIVKRKARRALARQACTLAGHIYAYAEVVHDDDLQQKVKYTMSDFARLKDGELPAICRNILDIAMQHVADLAGYNVTAATNTSFLQNIDAYEAMEQRPRNEISKRITSNQTMKVLFKKGDNLIKNQLDKIMPRFIETETAFYNTYIGNRVIVDSATISTRIKGKVVNAHDNTPIDNATIEIIETKQIATTTRNGNYALKRLLPGTWPITVSKPGFKSQTVTVIVVKPGGITRVNFQLEAEKAIDNG